MNQPVPLSVWLDHLDVDYGLRTMMLAKIQAGTWKPTGPYAVESEIAELILYAEERRPGITDRG